MTPNVVLSDPSSSTIQPGPSSSSSVPPLNSHAHSARRMFLGPTPIYTLPSVSRSREEDDAGDFVSQHGLRIFLQQGGSIEEWTDAKAHEYTERLKQNILESVAWHTLSKSIKKGKYKKGMAPVMEWKGSSFEIGKVFGVGVNLMLTSDDDAQYSRYSDDHGLSTQSPKLKTMTTVRWDGTSSERHLGVCLDSTTAAGSDSEPQPTTRRSASADHFTGSSNDSKPVDNIAEHSPSSSQTPLHRYALSFTQRGRSFLAASAASTGMEAAVADGAALPQLGRSKGRLNLKSILQRQTSVRKRKSVRYAATATPKMTLTGSPTGGRRPAPPDEVLNRSPSDVEDSSSAAAAIESSTSSELGDEEDPFISRDRMLVRVFHYDHDKLSNPFTEKDCRITHELDNKEWDEFLVIWRKHGIELYEDYRMPFKEKYLGHKKLTFVIPITNRTKLSIFSPVDLSFCLICPPIRSKATKSHRSLFHRSSKGLNVFILKPKARSRGVDWIWNLWRQLGGQLPPSFEIKCPLVHSRVRIPIPNNGELYQNIGRDFIIDACSDALDHSFAWKTVVGLPIVNGKKLELCWKHDTNMEWVWLHDDVNGVRRGWEVLFGLALQKLGLHSQLELHLAGHHRSHITVRGKEIEEPPSIEGFVIAFKGKAQVRVQYLLATHENHIFVIASNRAETPPTPTDLRAYAKSEVEVRADESARLRKQVIDARGFYDMRDILEVRRAAQHDASSARNATEMDREAPVINVLPGGGIDPEAESIRRTDSDLADEGGPAGMTSARDKARLKLHRTFELVLKDEKTVRFEAHSTSVAIEWVTHLRALVAYWKQRPKDDIDTEMNVQRECHAEDVITVSKRTRRDNTHMHAMHNESENSSLHLNDLWNWCMLEGCRQILRSGRLFVKTKIRSQYRYVHLVLVRSCLIQFKLSTSTQFPKPNYQNSRINLVDAYVVSGYYAALSLSIDEYDPNAPPTARLFADGLETRDLAEDTLFMLWYRPHNQFDESKHNDVPVMQLRTKHNLAIYRARSKLERDVWCWAINCEIERLARQTKDRERKIRQMGKPI